MNSSFDPDQPASRPTAYSPMEYPDVSMPSSAPNEPIGQLLEANSTPAPAPSPDTAELFALRIEEERKTITAKVRKEFEREIQRARAAITTAIDQFAQQRDEYFHQAEDEVVHLALAIVRRLIHRESQIDPRLLAGLIRYELDQLEAATSVHLFVSPDTLNGWSEVLGTMPRPVEFAADKALAASEARIETALGSTTISFEHELKEIERGFFDLLAHRPTPPEVRVQ